MKKTIIIPISLLFFFAGCEKKKFCDVYDPLTELPWLKKIVTEIDSLPHPHYSLIYKVILKDTKTKKRTEGFVLPASWTVYYNCAGEEICGAGGAAGAPCEKYDIVKEEVIYRKW
jgi:hypothetical protein